MGNKDQHTITTTSNDNTRFQEKNCVFIIFQQKGVTVFVYDTILEREKKWRKKKRKN